MDTIISPILQVNIEANKPTQLLNGRREICTQAAGSQVCDVKHCALLTLSCWELGSAFLLDRET